MSEPEPAPELLKRHHEGDPEASAALVARYAARLARLAEQNLDRRLAGAPTVDASGAEVAHRRAVDDGVELVLPHPCFEHLGQFVERPVGVDGPALRRRQRLRPAAVNGLRHPRLLHRQRRAGAREAS